MLYQPMSSPQRIRMLGCLVAMRRLLLASRASPSTCTAARLPSPPTFASPCPAQGTLNLPPLNRPRNRTKGLRPAAAYLRENERSARGRPCRVLATPATAASCRRHHHSVRGLLFRVQSRHSDARRGGRPMWPHDVRPAIAAALILMGALSVPALPGCALAQIDPAPAAPASAGDPLLDAYHRLYGPGKMLAQQTSGAGQAAATTRSEDETGSMETINKQLNNPVSSLWSLNFQNNFAISTGSPSDR